jgi:Right handed beta helix region
MEEAAEFAVALTEEDFLKEIRSCVDAQIPLNLCGRQVTLTRGAIRLKGRDHLTIQGGCISGHTHSLFQIDGDKRNHPRRLTLVGVKLVHTKTHQDPREIGAAVFCMGSCHVCLQNCHVTSKGGFAVWAKHRCQVSVEDCHIQNVARTAVACFNSVTVTVRNSSFRNVGVHGICGRGVSVMTLEQVTIRDCQVRAVMVYQGATISMEDCTVSHTHDPTTPTIHAQGPSVEEESGNNTESAAKCHDDYQSMIPSLRMIRCRVTDSAGPPLLIEGKVHQELVGSEEWT